MTTQIKLQTNGNYVAELKNSEGTVVGKAGPGQNVESTWIHVPNGDGYSVTERAATDDEVAAASQTLKAQNAKS